jgi:hypothetical protein
VKIKAAIAAFDPGPKVSPNPVRVKRRVPKPISPKFAKSIVVGLIDFTRPVAFRVKTACSCLAIKLAKNNLGYLN